MIAGTQADYQSDAGSTKDTPHLTLMGKPWGVFCEYFWENWPRYDGTALYFTSMKTQPPTWSIVILLLDKLFWSFTCCIGLYVKFQDLCLGFLN